MLMASHSLAASSTATLSASGTVAEELTITPEAIPTMNLVRGQRASVSHTVSVASTFASYSANIKSDQADGRMHLVGNVNQDLAMQLYWKSSVLPTRTALAGAPRPFAFPGGGTGDESVTVTFEQDVSASANIRSTQTYTLDIIYTVVSN